MRDIDKQGKNLITSILFKKEKYNENDNEKLSKVSKIKKKKTEKSVHIYLDKGNRFLV